MVQSSMHMFCGRDAVAPPYWIVRGFVEGWLYGGGWGDGVVVIVAVFGGRGWEVVVVGEVGAGAVGASSAHLAVAVAGVGASLPGCCRAMTGPAFAGGCLGLGRRRCRRRIPWLRRRPWVSSWTSRRVWATGQMTWIRGRSGAPLPPKARAPAFLARLHRLF